MQNDKVPKRVIFNVSPLDVWFLNALKDHYSGKSKAIQMSIRWNCWRLKILPPEDLVIADQKAKK